MLPFFHEDERPDYCTAVVGLVGWMVSRELLGGNSIWPKRFYTHGVSLGWFVGGGRRDDRPREGEGGEVVEGERRNLQ